MSTITRPMVNASPTGAGGQTAVLRPKQLPPGQQRIVKLVTAPQGAQNIRQQKVVASAAGGGQQRQGGGPQIILTQGGTPVRSGQILQVTGAGGHVQQIVVSQSGQIILSPQPQQQANSNASSANKIETTSGDTKPKEKAKKRYSLRHKNK